jgi:hypothetical protein
MPDSQAQAKWAFANQNNPNISDKERAFAREVVSGMSGRKMNSLPVRGTVKPKIASLVSRLSRKRYGSPTSA